MTKKKSFMISIGTLLTSIILNATVYAGCVWKWDCDQWGNCRQMPLCDSTLDIVPPKPPAIAPIPSPSIPPIQSPTIPPIGTSSCSQEYICDDYGNCRWQNVCQ